MSGRCRPNLLRCAQQRSGVSSSRAAEIQRPTLLALAWELRSPVGEHGRMAATGSAKEPSRRYPARSMDLETQLDD